MTIFLRELKLTQGKHLQNNNLRACLRFSSFSMFLMDFKISYLCDEWCYENKKHIIEEEKA